VFINITAATASPSRHNEKRPPGTDQQAADPEANIIFGAASTRPRGRGAYHRDRHGIRKTPFPGTLARIGGPRE
jgi:hypothetical protein